MLGLAPQIVISLLQTHLHGSLLRSDRSSNSPPHRSLSDHLMENRHLHPSAAMNCYIFLRCPLLPDVRIYVCLLVYSLCPLGK